MFLTDKYFSNPRSFLPLPPSKTRSTGDSSLLITSLRAFDDALAARLASLLPVPESSSPSSLPLTWLARAVELLALTLSDSSALLAGDSGDASAAILDSTAAILDACNAIAALCSRLLCSRLLIRFAVHLLLSRPDSALPRAREILAQWDITPSSPAPDDPKILESLAPRDTPRKISGARRAIYGVEALSFLVAGAALAALSGEGQNGAGIRISGQLPWAEAFEKVETAVAGKLRGGLAVEIVEAEAAVRKLAAVIDEEDDVGKTERLGSAVKKAEKATEEMKEGLSCLMSAVNGLFRAALAARHAALQSLRLEN